MPAPVSCPALSVRCYTISFTAFNVRCHGAVFFPATKSIGFANRITRRWLSPMVQNFVVRPDARRKKTGISSRNGSAKVKRTDKAGHERANIKKKLMNTTNQIEATASANFAKQSSNEPDVPKCERCHEPTVNGVCPDCKDRSKYWPQTNAQKLLLARVEQVVKTIHEKKNTYRVDITSQIVWRIVGRLKWYAVMSFDKKDKNRLKEMRSATAIIEALESGLN